MALCCQLCKPYSFDQEVGTLEVTKGEILLIGTLFHSHKNIPCGDSPFCQFRKFGGVVYSTEHF